MLACLVPRGHLRTAVVLAMSPLLVGCGTAVYHHTIDIAVDDPTGRLGPPPTEISLFDRQMGYSAGWMHEHAGPSTPTEPYRRELSSTASVMFWDRSLPGQLVASVAVPAFNADGYYVFILEPGHSLEGRLAGGFTRWDNYFPTGDGAPLPARYRAERGEQGWLVVLTLEIPGG